VLRTLKILANYYQAYGAPINDWTVTEKNFDDFMCSEVGMISTKRNDALISFPTPASTPRQEDLLSVFKKGINKKDASLFNAEGFQAVRLMTLLHCGTGTAQDASDVPNPSFKLPTGEQDLFQAKQK